MLWGFCTPNPMTYADAVRLIRLRQRTQGRPKEQAADDSSRPLTEAEAYELLGVSQACTPDELANAYRRKAMQRHPDKLETMADELKEYATRRTARLNEAYAKLKSTTVQHRVGGE